MSNLILDHNSASQPENNVEPAQVPQLGNAGPSGNPLGDALGPATRPAGPSVGEQIMSTPASPALSGPGPDLQGVQINNTGRHLIEAGANQARAEVDWQRNQLANITPNQQSPLFRSSMGDPWVNSQPLRYPNVSGDGDGDLNSLVQQYRDAFGDRAVDPFNNALQQNNSIVGREPGSGAHATRADVQAPGWLRRILEGSSRVIASPIDLANMVVRRASGGRLGSEVRPSQRFGEYKVAAVEEGVAQFAAVGGQALTLAEVVSDVVNAPAGLLFDQTLGRAIFGSANASGERRSENLQRMRVNDHFAPARDLGAQYGEYGGNNVLRGEFGAYGRGLPGAVNLSTDYVGNLVRAGGYVSWRRSRSSIAAMQGEITPYEWARNWTGDLEILGRALNPFDNSEIYSFFDDPRYSPIAVQHWREGQDVPWGERSTRRQVEDVALMALGFILDMNTPEPSLRGLRSLTRGTAATTTVADAARSASRPNPARFRQLPDPWDTPMDLAPRQFGTPGAQARFPEIADPWDADFENLFVSPQGLAVDVPAGTIRPINEFALPGPDRVATQSVVPPGRSLTPEQLIDNREVTRDLWSAERAPSPEDVRETSRDLWAPEPERTPDAVPPAESAQRALPGENRVNLEDAQEMQRSPWDEPTRPRQADVDETTRDLWSDDAPQTRTPEEPQQPLLPDAEARTRRLDPEGETTRDLWEGRPEYQRSLDEDIDWPAERPRTASPLQIEPGPVRQPGSAETRVARAVAQGDVVSTPRGMVRASDAVREAQYQLINNRLAARAIQNVPEGSRTPDMRRTLDNLTNEFDQLRTTIAGRPMRPIEAPVEAPRLPLADELPIVPQTTLTPPANPSTLYQWSRNLPEGQRIYVKDAEIIDRTAEQLSELARFFGHTDAPRSRVLSGEQLADLRMQYGRLYSSVGPEIDRAALTRLNVEGVGRVETGRANAVTGTPQASKVVSNDLARDPVNRTRTPDDFNRPEAYTQSELSQLSDTALAEELSGRFSPREIYREGRPNRALADTRNDLLQEVEYRSGGNPEDVLEFFPDDIQRYAEMNQLDLESLDSRQMSDLQRRAAAEATLRESVDVETVNAELPDGMMAREPGAETQEAIREMVVAERHVEDSMRVVRDRVQILEELEASMEAPMQALERATDSNNLLPGSLAVGTHGQTRQAAVDVIADRASAQARRVATPPASQSTPAPRVSTGDSAFDGLANTIVDRLDADKTDVTGWATLEEFRRQPELQNLSRAQQDAFLYKLEQSGAIELITDAETRLRTPEQRAAGIEQDIGGPLYFIDIQPRPVSSAVNTGDTGRVFYHGGRFATPDLASVDPYQTGRTRQPLGAGFYVYESSDVAESAASAFVAPNDVGHLPTTPEGRVTPLTVNVERVMDGSQKMNADPELWAGLRNIIRDAFPGNKKDATNAIAAARRHGLPGFYDYMATKFTQGAQGGVDEVRMFEFQTTVSNYLRSQGVEAISWDSPDGRILNILPGPEGRLPINADAGTARQVSGPRVIDQATGSVNFAQAELRAYGTESARQASEHASFRFGSQLRKQVIERVSEASRRVDDAFNRLDRADANLRRAADADNASARRIQSDIEQQRYRDSVQNNYRRDCL